MSYIKEEPAKLIRYCQEKYEDPEDQKECLCMQLEKLNNRKVILQSKLANEEGYNQTAPYFSKGKLVYWSANKLYRLELEKIEECIILVKREMKGIQSNPDPLVPKSPHDKGQQRDKTRGLLKMPLQKFENLLRVLCKFSPSLVGKESLDNAKTIYSNIKENRENVPRNITNRIYWVGSWGFWEPFYDLMRYKKVFEGYGGYTVFFEKYCLKMDSKAGNPKFYTRNKVRNGCRKNSSVTNEKTDMLIKSVEHALLSLQ